MGGRTRIEEPRRPEAKHSGAVRATETREHSPKLGTQLLCEQTLACGPRVQALSHPGSSVSQLVSLAGNPSHLKKVPELLPDSVMVAAGVCNGPQQQDLLVAKVFNVEFGGTVPHSPPGCVWGRLCTWPTEVRFWLWLFWAL